MSPTFIFMLTRNDKTIPDARSRLDEVLAAGVQHIGFKDVGLGFSEQRLLADDIRKGGGSVYLEVVSLDRSREAASVRAAVDLEVDYLLGGTHVGDTIPMISGTPIRYYPFPGRVVGRPNRLKGTIQEIVESAVMISSHHGVHGLDLLAYRSAVNVPALLKAVRSGANGPIIVAGDVDRVSRIVELTEAQASGFTVGTAALDGRFPACSADLTTQLRVILSASEKSTAV